MIKYIFLILSVLSLTLNSNAQLTSGADFSGTVEFSDSIYLFTFCSENLDIGGITATDSTGTGGFDFVWTQFDTISNTFSIPLSSSINADSTVSTVNSLSSGGYKVQLIKSGIEQEYIAWLFINDRLRVNVQVLDPLDCELVSLRSYPVFETGFKMYDTLSGSYVTLSNRKGEYHWWSEPDSDLPDYDATFSSKVNDYYENTRFFFSMTDRFGCYKEAYIDYTPIATKADYTIEIFNEDTEIYETSEAPSGSSPLKVRFTNTSENGNKYSWFFGDTLIKNDQDSLITHDELEIPEHTYYYSGYYYAELLSESSYDCEDSVSYEIQVTNSRLEIPNFFTPNKDGQNDIFIFDDESIRYFQITIVSRTGKEAYEYTGDIGNWQGWDGNQSNGMEAAEGIYYYYVTATGWDNVEYELKGFFYLYRNY